MEGSKYNENYRYNEKRTAKEASMNHDFKISIEWGKLAFVKALTAKGKAALEEMYGIGAVSFEIRNSDLPKFTDWCLENGHTFL